MNIRPFDKSDADYEAIVNIYNLAFPDDLSAVEAWKSWDAIREPKFFHQRLVAEVDGQQAGYIVIEEPRWTYRLGKYMVYVVVHPEYRRRGIGTALYDAAIDILNPKQPDTLVSDTRENQAQSIKFLEKRGYQQVQRQPISRLEVARFDASRFSETIARFEASGLCIWTPPELQKIDPDYWSKLHDLDSVVMQDVPMPEPYTPPPLDQFIKIVEDPKRGYNPDAWFIAGVPSEAGVGEYVGMSCLWNDTTGTPKMYTGLTGVRREYRRKGVATALKVRAIQYARHRGATVIETDNEENNPMFQLNLALGFHEVTAYLEYEKRLQAAEDM